MNRILTAALLCASIGAPANAQQSTTPPPAAAQPAAPANAPIAEPAVKSAKPPATKPSLKVAAVDRKVLLRKRVVEAKADVDALTRERDRIRNVISAAAKAKRKNTVIGLRTALRSINTQLVKARADYTELHRVAAEANKPKKPVKPAPAAKKPA